MPEVVLNTKTHGCLEVSGKHYVIGLGDLWSKRVVKMKKNRI